MSRPIGGYIKPNGIRIVSNTEALTKSRVRRWQGNPAAWERRATIGTAVHGAAAVLDCNVMTWNDAPWEWMEPYYSVDSEVQGFVWSWEECKRVERLEFSGCAGIPLGGLIEHSLFAVSGITEFATTLDRVGLRDGFPAIIELKTPQVVEPYWGPQLAGQEEALLQTFGPPLVRPFRYERWAAQLFASGKPGKLIPFTEKTDRDVFLWSLGIATFNINAYGWEA